MESGELADRNYGFMDSGYAVESDVDDIIEEKLEAVIEKAARATYHNHTNSERFISCMNIPYIRVAYPTLEILSISLKGMNENHPHGDQVFKHESMSKEQIGNKFRGYFLCPEYDQYIQEMKETKSVVETGLLEIDMLGVRHTVSLIYKPCINTRNHLYEFYIIILNHGKIKVDVGPNTSVSVNTTPICTGENASKCANMELMSYMTHELKAPLTVIHSAVQLIDCFCSDELSDKAQRFVNKIRQSAMQQLRLVNNFLDINKMDAGYLKLNKSNVDIVMMTKAILNAVSVVCENKGIEVSFLSEIQSRIVLLDDEKYERMLLNILSNAIKFTPKGEILEVGLKLENGYVRIAVRDKGVGIPEDKQELIFQKFGQVGNYLIRSGEGTGLGLCLAKMLANAHNGDIELSSEIGKGSEFTIVLPDCISTEEIIKPELLQQLQEDRLVQSIKVEFSNIYL